MRPLLLDLFCGAGGAAMGYFDAGFSGVVGVDIHAQPRYPFDFFQGDALSVLREMNGHLPFEAIHASPPCQAYSVTKSLHAAEYPRLIAETRELLLATGLPFVIENVEGARSELRDPIRLCGSSFGLGVRRHRLFECHGFEVGLVPPCNHGEQPEPIDVTGTGGPRRNTARTSPGGGNSRKPESLAHAREAMGIDWMTRQELSEAIPPAYTAWIGERLYAHVTEEAA